MSTKPQDSEKSAKQNLSPKSKEKTSEDEFMAAAIGDVEWLKHSLKHVKQINFDKNGLAAIHLASLHGRLDCIKLLVERFKQDINLASSTGWRPIHLAISNQTGKRSFAVLDYLLSKGADVGVVNDDGISPVHQAASEGHIQCLKALIEHGARINIKDSRGHSPMDLAKLWGHRQCARIMATEQWHQEKDEIAQKLSQINKKHTIDELNKLAGMEELNDSEAYLGWLSSRGLARSSSQGRVVSARSRRLERVDTSKRSAEIQSLYRPNSIAAVNQAKSRRSSSTPPVRRERTMDSFPESTFYTIHEKPRPAAKAVALMEPEKRAEVMANAFLNNTDWDFSPQCDLLGHYHKDLEDCYPRDPLTRLPHKDATPKYLATHKNVPVTAFSDPESYKKERKVVFGPLTILDAQKKIKYSEDQLLNKPQVFLHLCSTLDSHLFQRGLYVQAFPSKTTQPINSVRCTPPSPRNESSLAANLPKIA